ncbi:TPA: host cell division inhibitor Icd-like protein [Salmonella enterica]|nr:host cell division inhibitor Icd-like protein [Salmonella enterica subsp. enterica serovar Newport]EKN5738055.1 host cell division inhibitor Icd-like protein [Salmonella enterica]HAF6187698.1 host cell division inhibitor Icd-like protein [Salmonella enterica]
MANRQHTQTRPEFQYIFSAIPRNNMAAGSVRVTVAANTLREARHKVKESGYVAIFYKTRKLNVGIFPKKTQATFIWRFCVLGLVECHVINITANTEQEAREQAPEECVVIFMGRFAAKGGRHA